jgi:hypothetical protein
MAAAAERWLPSDTGFTRYYLQVMAQTAVDKIPKELAKLARAKNIPADWTSPHKHRAVN